MKAEGRNGFKIQKTPNLGGGAKILKKWKDNENEVAIRR